LKSSKRLVHWTSLFQMTMIINNSNQILLISLIRLEIWGRSWKSKRDRLILSRMKCLWLFSLWMSCPRDLFLVRMFKIFMISLSSWVLRWQLLMMNLLLNILGFSRLWNKLKKHLSKERIKKLMRLKRGIMSLMIIWIICCKRKK
jgi:hypothetical protein